MEKIISGAKAAGKASGSGIVAAAAILAAVLAFSDELGFLRRDDADALRSEIHALETQLAETSGQLEILREVYELRERER